MFWFWFKTLKKRMFFSSCACFFVKRFGARFFAFFRQNNLALQVEQPFFENKPSKSNLVFLSSRYRCAHYVQQVFVEQVSDCGIKLSPLEKFNAIKPFNSYSKEFWFPSAESLFFNSAVFFFAVITGFVSDLKLQNKCYFFEWLFHLLPVVCAAIKVICLRHLSESVNTT